MSWQATSSCRLLLSALLGLPLGAGVAGCASGHPYQRRDAPEDKGVITVYRPWSFLGGAIGLKVDANQMDIGGVGPGEFRTFLANPGQVELSASSEVTFRTTIDVEPGQHHFVRAQVTVGFLKGRPHFMPVPEEVAEEDVHDCLGVDLGDFIVTNKQPRKPPDEIEREQKTTKAIRHKYKRTN